MTKPTVVVDLHHHTPAASDDPMCAGCGDPLTYRTRTRDVTFELVVRIAEFVWNQIPGFCAGIAVAAIVAQFIR